MKKLLILLLSAFSLTVFAETEKIRIAVFDPIATFAINDGTDVIVREITSSTVVNSGLYEVIDRMTLNKLAEEQNFARTGLMDETQAVQIGKIAGASKVLFSVLASSGTKNMLTTKLLDVLTGAIEKQQYKLIDQSMDIVLEVENLTKALIGKDNMNLTATPTTNQNNIEQQYEKALDYFYGRNGVIKDYSAAVNIFKTLAEQGYAAAQYNLGVCYEEGKGVTKDSYAAVNWYHKAAEQGVAVAQYNLGWCYSHGEGVTQDSYAAVNWYRKAAEQGYAAAQCNLGVCYEEGKGVTKDYYTAVSWFRKAAEQGDDVAQYNLGLCYEKGKGVTKDSYAAVNWYRKAAEQGYADAQYNLGNCYCNGYGVTQDYYTAVSWFRKAAEQGYADAQYNLGVCYYNGYGVTQDSYAAESWFRKAAEQGIAEAREVLSRLKTK